MTWFDPRPTEVRLAFLRARANSPIHAWFSFRRPRNIKKIHFFQAPFCSKVTIFFLGVRDLSLSLSLAHQGGVVKGVKQFSLLRKSFGKQSRAGYFPFCSTQNKESDVSKWGPEKNEFDLHECRIVWGHDDITIFEARNFAKSMAEDERWPTSCIWNIHTELLVVE